MTRSSFAGKAAQVLPLVALALLVALLTLNRLGASDVCGGDEATVGMIVQQMVEHHHLLFPLENCKIPIYKPPLFHWTATALDYTMGQRIVDSFNLRLPSALYAIAGVILTMFFAAGLLGMRGAILSGAILAGSYQYISQGRIGRVDMTLTFFETLSLYAFLWWFMRDTSAPPALHSKRPLHYLLAIAMGLAVLAKGPVGAVLPAAAIVVFLAIDRHWRTLAHLFKPGPLLVGAAIASSWYLACLFGRQMGFLGLQFGSENVGRFFGSLGSMPPWYYIRPLLLNSVPLSLLVPLAVVSALRTGGTAHRDDQREGRAAMCARFLAIFWIVTLLFFELAAFKRRNYLVPLWPAAAVMLSWWILDRVVPRIGAVAYHAVIATCLFLATVNFFFIPAYELHSCGVPLSLAGTLAGPLASLEGRSYGAQSVSFRNAAAEVNRLAGSGDPIFIYGFSDANEPFLFYLGRCAPPLRGKLSTIPDGYVVADANAWERRKHSTAGLHAVARIPYRHADLILLHSEAAAASR